MDLLDVVPYTERSPAAKQPDGITLKLARHQLVALEALKTIDSKQRVLHHSSRTIECYGNVAVYADPPGTGGKTITTLAMIQELSGGRGKPRLTAVSGGYNFEHYTNWIRDTHHATTPTTSATLVVVLDGVFDHWIAHLKMTTLSYFAVNMVSKKKTNVGPDLVAQSGNFAEFDVVLCRDSQYAKFVGAVNEIWNRVVFDEIDTIQLGAKTYYVGARMMWFISASYDNLRYTKTPGFIRDLVSQTYFWQTIKPFVVRGDPVFVEASFLLLNPNVWNITCKTPLHICVLQGNTVVPSAVLKCLDAGNVLDALAILGAAPNSIDIIDVVRTVIDRQIATVQLDLEVATGGVVGGTIVSEPTRLKNVAFFDARLADLQTKKREFEWQFHNLLLREDCGICHGALHAPTMLSCCQHTYCGRCVSAHMASHQSCPNCRATTGLVRAIQSAGEPIPRPLTNEYRNLSKIDSMLKIVKDRVAGSKIVVTAMEPNSLAPLMTALNSSGIKCMLYESDAVLDQFLSETDTTVLLVCSKLVKRDISFATDVLLFHHLPRDVENQVIGRAQRPGRIGRVNIWKLQYEHEQA